MGGIALIQSTRSMTSTAALEKHVTVHMPFSGRQQRKAEKSARLRVNIGERFAATLGDFKLFAAFFFHDVPFAAKENRNVGVDMRIRIKAESAQRLDAAIDEQGLLALFGQPEVSVAAVFQELETGQALGIAGDAGAWTAAVLLSADLAQGIKFVFRQIVAHCILRVDSGR